MHPHIWSASDNAVVGRDMSAGRKASLPWLGSSEATPSEHSSIYDANPLSPSLKTSGCSGEDSDTEGNGHEYVSPHLKNRALGTKLSTITEQKSVRALGPARAQAPFQRRVVTLQPRHDRKPSLGQQRRAFSVDENALSRLRCGSDTSQATSQDSTILHLRNHCELRPTKPLYPLPKRDSTPQALSAWDGIDTLQPRSSAHSLRTSLSQISQYLRQGASSGIRLRAVLCLDEPKASAPSPRRPAWRPPVSGHSTRRFENLESHPFATAPLARHNRSHASSSGRSPSQRSLGYAAGHAVPVSPHRVSARADQRSATLPASATVRAPQIARRFPLPGREPAWSVLPRDTEQSAPIPPVASQPREQPPSVPSGPQAPPSLQYAIPQQRARPSTNEPTRVAPPSVESREIYLDESNATILHGSSQDVQYHISLNRQFAHPAGATSLENTSPSSHVDLRNDVTHEKLCKHELARLTRGQKQQTQARPGRAVHPATHFDGASSQTQPLREVPPVVFQDHANVEQASAINPARQPGGRQTLGAPGPSVQGGSNHVVDGDGGGGSGGSGVGGHLATATTFSTAPTCSTTFNLQPNLRHARTSTLAGRA